MRNSRRLEEERVATGHLHLFSRTSDDQFESIVPNEIHDELNVTCCVDVKGCPLPGTVLVQPEDAAESPDIWDTEGIHYTFLQALPRCLVEHAVITGNGPLEPRGPTIAHGDRPGGQT